MIKINGKAGISVELVAHSVNDYKNELMTFRLHYPRIIHAELMTHRMFSRNASSSRAIPVTAMLDQVRGNPAMPVKFGKNQSGMQDAGDHDALVEWDDWEFPVEGIWNKASQTAADFSEAISQAGYHKQVANRLLEPFQFMNTIVSMTDIDNFWHLRLHKDADPTFVNLAECMKEAYDQSVPERVDESDYHLPFIDKIKPDFGEIKYFAADQEVTKEEAIKISVSLCCQVSYRKADFSKEKAMKIWDMLVTMNPIHASPLEHVAKPMRKYGLEARRHVQSLIESYGIKGVNAMYCGNFKGWIQYRKEQPNENMKKFSGTWE